MSENTTAPAAKSAGHKKGNQLNGSRRRALVEALVKNRMFFEAEKYTLGQAAAHLSGNASAGTPFPVTVANVRWAVAFWDAGWPGMAASARPEATKSVEGNIQSLRRQTERIRARLRDLESAMAQVQEQQKLLDEFAARLDELQRAVTQLESNTTTLQRLGGPPVHVRDDSNPWRLPKHPLRPTTIPPTRPTTPAPYCGEQDASDLPTLRGIDSGD